VVWELEEKNLRLPDYHSHLLSENQNILRVRSRWYRF